MWYTAMLVLVAVTTTAISEATGVALNSPSQPPVTHSQSDHDEYSRQHTQIAKRVDDAPQPAAVGSLEVLVKRTAELYIPMMFNDPQTLTATIRTELGIARDLASSNWQRDSKDRTFWRTNARYWTRKTYDDFSFAPVMEALSALTGLVPKETVGTKSVEGKLIKHSLSQHVVWTQYARYNHPTEAMTMQATQAKYEMIVNSERQFIVILHAVGPLAILEGQKVVGHHAFGSSVSPEVSAWAKARGPVARYLSDFLGYECYLAGFSTRNRLKFVVFQTIPGPPETLTVVQRILQDHLQGPAFVVPLWPGLTFEIGTWQYDALLACRDFKGLPWFLSQRKKIFAISVLSAVTIFRGTGELDNAVSVVWHIKRVTPEIREQAKTTLAKALATFPAAGRASTPVDLTGGEAEDDEGHGLFVTPEPQSPGQNIPTQGSHQRPFEVDDDEPIASGSGKRPRVSEASADDMADTNLQAASTPQYETHHETYQGKGKQRATNPGRVTQAASGSGPQPQDQVAPGGPPGSADPPDAGSGSSLVPPGSHGGFIEVDSDSESGSGSDSGGRSGGTVTPTNRGGSSHHGGGLETQDAGSSEDSSSSDSGDSEDSRNTLQRQIDDVLQGTAGLGEHPGSIQGVPSTPGARSGSSSPGSEDSRNTLQRQMDDVLEGTDVLDTMQSVQSPPGAQGGGSGRQPLGHAARGSYYGSGGPSAQRDGQSGSG